MTGSYVPKWVMRISYILLICSAWLVDPQPGLAQVNVGLDNWFNRETSAKTGKPFHYLWGDTADSGYSRWGEIFTGKGATISTLDRPTSKSLKQVDVYIIVDPDSATETPSPNYILPDDVKVIEHWVKKGGTLVLLANDSKHCGLTHLNYLSYHFGIVFNSVMLRPVVNNQYEMGAITKFSDHAVFKGLNKIFLKEVASISLIGDARPVLTDNGHVIMAETEFGKGFVFAVGDPWIYNEYIDHDRLPKDFENRKAAENLTEYLLLRAKQ
jgi:unsaturated rhamnogalacturonyl hydrolase